MPPRYRRPKPPGAVVVLVTCPNQKVGERIGRTLVQERLAACASIVPGVTSIHRWQGKVSRDAEILLVIKTQKARLASLMRRVEGIHPYSVPEILALSLTAGSAPYLAWMREATG
jgi:periplasmic divalent cation tolerance protein